MKPIISAECHIDWKHCEQHDFTYLYGSRCPNCITEKKMSDTETVVEAVDEVEVVVGMTKQEALDFLAAKNITSRVATENGETFFLTLDFNPSRVNLEVQDNKVVDYSRG